LLLVDQPKEEMFWLNTSVTEAFYFLLDISEYMTERDGKLLSNLRHLFSLFLFGERVSRKLYLVNRQVVTASCMTFLKKLLDIMAGSTYDSINPRR